MTKIREKYYAFLRAFFKDVPTSLYKLLLVVLIIYSVLPLFFYPRLNFYRFYYIMSFIVLGIISFFLIIYYPIKWYVEKYYQTIQTKRINKPHLAIILIKYDILFKSLFYILMNLKHLFIVLDNNNIPYTVYLVKNKEEFTHIINDKNVKSVFVFSHGQRHGVKFGNEVWHYCNLPKVKHIQFVGQFHCNHYTGKSLYDYLECNGVMTEGVTLYQDINKYIFAEEYVPVLKKVFRIN